MTVEPAMTALIVVLRPWGIMGVRADSLLPISRFHLVSTGNRAGSKFPSEFRLIAKGVAFN